MTAAPAIHGPTILTASGHYFDFRAPEASRFGILDIAHALSNLCRFTGHTARFYSVAEHCVHASRIVPPADAFAALMHDAAEAFLGDVSRPLKSLLPDYMALERHVEAVVLARFGLPPTLPHSVKLADRAMLLAEQRQALRNADRWPDFDGTAPANVTLHFWQPDDARHHFLARFVELGGHDRAGVMGA